MPLSDGMRGYLDIGLRLGDGGQRDLSLVAFGFNSLGLSDDGRRATLYCSVNSTRFSNSLLLSLAISLWF